MIARDAYACSAIDFARGGARGDLDGDGHFVCILFLFVSKLYRFCCRGIHTSDYLAGRENTKRWREPLAVMGSEEAAISNLTSIVTSALEARGVLGKIRAELRASVFSAIHEQQQQQGMRPGTDPAVLRMFHQEGAGRVAAQVRTAPVNCPCGSWIS